jgi:hypothetical protein
MDYQSELMEHGIHDQAKRVELQGILGVSYTESDESPGSVSHTETLIIVRVALFKNINFPAMTAYDGLGSFCDVEEKLLGDICLGPTFYWANVEDAGLAAHHACHGGWVVNIVSQEAQLRL